jgi:CheY-like chemotaxis protein
MTPLATISPNDTYPLILIVDDDPSLRLALEEVFDFAGYAVMSAGSAREGLQALHQLDEKPSLIISDVLMTDMDGYEFFHAVRAHEKWRDIPFIFLSAKGRLRDEAEKRGLRVNGYVSKPFVVEDLLTTIARLIGH